MSDSLRLGIMIILGVLVLGFVIKLVAGILAIAMPLLILAGIAIIVYGLINNKKSLGGGRRYLP